MRWLRLQKIFLPERGKGNADAAGRGYVLNVSRLACEAQSRAAIVRLRIWRSLKIAALFGYCFELTQRYDFCVSELLHRQQVEIAGN